MKVGLFFGSFNPVHVGHMIISNHMLNQTDLDQVWMVVTPHNPHKKRSSLAKDYDRLHLVRLAIGDHDRLKASDIEFGLPKPSYTIDTLTYITEKYPDNEFNLILGGDNLKGFHRWKNYQHILERHHLYVYKRPGYEGAAIENHHHVHLIEAPLLNISSSYLRKCIKEGKSIRYLTPDKVFEYLEASPIYHQLLS